MNWYAKTLAHHPFIVLAAVAVLSGICLIVPFMTKKLPSFTDPTLGFETRGTTLSERLTAWQNLAEALRPSGPLTGNPSELVFAASEGKLTQPKFNTSVLALSPDDVVNQDTKAKARRKKKKKKLDTVANSPEALPTAITVPTDQVYDWDQHRNWTFGVNVSEAQPDFGNSSEPWKSLRDELSVKKTLLEHNHEHLSKDGFFCGAPSPEYSHMVLSTTDGSDFLSLAALRSACGLEILLRQNPHFTSNCQTSKSETCCHSWTLHNYIAVLHGHTTCLQIKEHDVEETRKLLIDCAQYYHNENLPDDCQGDKLGSSSDCFIVPPHCTKYNAVYNILHYLVDVDFLPPRNMSQVFVKNSMLFLPMARSSAMMPYYNALDSGKLSFGNVKVSAMDLGLKTTLFDDCLVRDTWLISLGALFVFFSMWIYTESFLVTFMAIIAIGLSLGISYFLYTIVFEMQFFPFMNLLACVVAVGIGADDAFIFCKVWSCTKNEKSCLSPLQIVQETLNHALLSMFITSFTTSVAFFTSFVSSITAIRCFSIFAGMAVVANFALMVTWLPASVIISEHINVSHAKWLSLKSHFHGVKSYLENISNGFDKSLEVVVVHLPLLWVIFLGSLAVCSAVTVLYYPGLQLPVTSDFQLFSKSHPFEQYDGVYRDKFRFEQLEKHSDSKIKLPLRFVWGVKPVDSGDYFNPYSKGKLQFDLSFDMAAPESQVWLKEFCGKVRNQSFYQSTIGPLLPNCYIETLESWMKRRCKDTLDNIDHTPCCEMSALPYKKSVFKNCTVQAMASLYRTSRNLFDPGLAGPKFSKNSSHPKIRAVVIEYDSNLSYMMPFENMNIFYNQVESWMQAELKTAPSGMRQGWFVSELRFYDLQYTIAGSTVSALLISMAMSVIVLFLVTLDSVVSLFAVLSVTCTIFMTMAILLLLGWELNVLESVAINTSIGLAVDFSLHYSVSYRLAPDNANREEAVKFTLHRMGGPTAMGALTTGIAGLFMLPSSVLAYNQIGLFLVVIMTVSWTYATFFLMPLLCICGPRHGFGQFSYKGLFCCLRNRGSLSRSPSVLNRSNKSVYGNVLSESTLSASSTTYPLHTSASEGHELDAFTNAGRKMSQTRKRSGSLQTSQPAQKATSDQSPSVASACTVILCDDADLSRQHM